MWPSQSSHAKNVLSRGGNGSPTVQTDIYDLLRYSCMGQADGCAASQGTLDYNAAGYLAQLAVNIVDSATRTITSRAFTGTPPTSPNGSTAPIAPASGERGL